MYFYYKMYNGGRVAFYAEEYQEHDNFLYLEYQPTAEEQEMIDRHYILYVRDGILVYEKPEEASQIEQQTILQEQKEELLQKLNDNTLTLEDLAQFILSL